MQRRCIDGVATNTGRCRIILASVVPELIFYIDGAACDFAEAVDLPVNPVN